MINVDFTNYYNILCAEKVSIHDLSLYFNRQEMDFDEFGNVFIGFNEDTRGLPILVAHTDNVLHGKRCPLFSLDKKRIVGKSAGIGFDDKAGIIAIIELWEHYKNQDKQMFRIIFTTDEETGGEGAEAMYEDWYADAAWMLELDRRSDRDLIQVSGGTRLCSDAFAKRFEDLGFEKATGTFTDVNVFKKRFPHINMANLSIGYYNAHTNDEYLDVDAFNSIVNKVATFIDAEYEFMDDEEDIEPDWDYHNYTPAIRLDSVRGNTERYCDCCGRKINGLPVRQGSFEFCSETCKKDFNQGFENDYDDDDMLS